MTRTAVPPSRGARARMLRHWPLLLVTAGVLVVGLVARAWMHSRWELADDNDLPLLGVSDTALGTAIGAALLVVVVAHLMLDRQRKEIEHALEEARAALRDQFEQEALVRRTTLLGALAGGLAHELGQPLSAARVGIEGLHYLRQLGREPTTEQIERTLDRVGMSLLAMTQTIEHLRGLTTQQGIMPLSPIDLGELVTALLADRDQWLRFRDTRIQFERPPQPVLAMGDPAGLRLVLTNLLRNAVEAVSGQSDERRLVKVTVGPGATVAVHDSGPGIPPELREHLFDPYFSTKDGALRGIGLSLARASAQRMGGDVGVTSQLGSGSTFSLHLTTPEEHRSLLHEGYA